MSENQALTKQETVARLYGLRAGLSVLSEIYDKISVSQRTIQESKDSIEKNQYQMHQAVIRGQGAEEEYKKRQKAFSDAKTELDKTKFDGLRKFYYVSIAILVVLYLIGMAIDSAGGNYDPLIEPIGIYTLFCIVFSIYFFKKHSAYKDLKETFENAKKQLDEFKLGEIKAKLADEHSKCNAQMKKSEKTIDQENKTLDLLLDDFKLTYRATQDEYCAFLDERDWGNVDLIIFNYETGRAIDLRDALMQVDNERRNQRLERAIENAQAVITQSISSAMMNLQSSFEQQFSRLDSRINNVSKQLKANSDSQIQAINEANRSQQALLNKMNTSSDKMARDVQTMRELAERTYYGN